jgi:hypothetical protein
MGDGRNGAGKSRDIPKGDKNSGKSPVSDRLLDQRRHGAHGARIPAKTLE